MVVLNPAPTSGVREDVKHAMTMSYVLFSPSPLRTFRFLLALMQRVNYL